MLCPDIFETIEESNMVDPVGLKNSTDRKKAASKRITR